MNVGQSAVIPSRRRRRHRWHGLRAKLLLSYLAVVIAGLLASSAVTSLLAPSFFATHMAQMMAATPSAGLPGGGPGASGIMGMMGDMASMAAMYASASDAALADSFRAAMNRALWTGGAVAALAALAASLFVTGRVVGPIRRLATASRSIAAGRYAERVPAGGDDELAALAASFNEMAGTLEATEQRRLELIGDVAHELRTPVATLEGYLEGLLDGVVEPTAETWAKLHGEAGRMRRLIDDLQELSRAEAGRFSLHPAAVDPAAIAQAALDRLAGQFEEKGLTLSTDLPQRVPVVYADRDRAVQVLTNLLTNALRHTPVPGRVTVAVQRKPQAVQFVVTDTGTGIDAEHLPHVFERFYRVDRSRSRALGGSGIGLTIARALVEAMGGQIWAESAGLGKGATFGFTLPLAPRASSEGAARFVHKAHTAAFAGAADAAGVTVPAVPAAPGHAGRS
ncbi:MAG: HAMP domain-containing protein [Chloroflexi bacterium]|nr:HAMP domain-containing protein [Chloroflexota bacterium]